MTTNAQENCETAICAASLIAATICRITRSNGEHFPAVAYAGHMEPPRVHRVW